MKKTNRIKRNQQAFSLVELMVVIIIIGLLAGVVGNAVMKNIGIAKQGTAKTQIKMFKSAVNDYRISTDQYPPNDMGLLALIEQPPGVEGWTGPYLEDPVIPKDPWGNDYIYWLTEEPGKPFVIYSLGKDGQEGGDGENKDIYDYELPEEEVST